MIFNGKFLTLQMEFGSPLSPPLYPILLRQLYLHHLPLLLLLFLLFIVLQYLHQLLIVVVRFFIFFRQVVYFVLFCTVASTHPYCLPFRADLQPFISFKVTFAVSTVVYDNLLCFIVFLNFLMITQPLTINRLHVYPWWSSWILKFLFYKHFLKWKLIFFQLWFEFSFN